MVDLAASLRSSRRLLPKTFLDKLIIFHDVDGIVIKSAPSPPLKESVDPTLCFSTRRPFEEIHDGPPELYVVEVAVNSPPRRDRGKRESYLLF